ncbi:MAG: AraC family transcriptional regulator, partial [Pseudomonadota bacterium]
MGASQTTTQGTAGERANAPHTVRSHFHAPPAIFDGCFTTFYHMALEVEDGGVVVDYLQPEWANIRFFTGSQPRAEIAGSKLSGSHFGATGPSSLPCRFELGSAQMWGIGFLPIGWARFFDDEAYGLANTVWDGRAHPAFARFDAMSKVLT